MKKKTIITLLVLLILSIAGYVYYQYDKENLKIDYYNFKQLEKAKKVVENLDGEQKYYYVDNLGSLNYKFDTDIEPLDKRYCYHVYYQFDNEEDKIYFEFGFKLYSKLFKLIYGGKYYNYPSLWEAPKETEECKKEIEISKGRYTGIPSCAGLNADYYDYMEVVNNPCKKQ